MEFYRHERLKQRKTFIRCDTQLNRPTEKTDDYYLFNNKNPRLKAGIFIVKLCICRSRCRLSKVIHAHEFCLQTVHNLHISRATSSMASYAGFSNVTITISRHIGIKM